MNYPWEKIPIGRLCKLINGRAFKPKEWTDSGLPIIRIQNSTHGRKLIAEKRKTSAGQYNVNSASLQSICFPCPPLTLQKIMVNEMHHISSSTDRILEIFESKSKELLSLESAILHKAFSGEL